ncbi:hypothetical protein [Streptomyces sp. NPDC001744]
MTIAQSARPKGGAGEGVVVMPEVWARRTVKVHLDLLVPKSKER